MTVTLDLKPNDIGFILSIDLDIPPAPTSAFLMNLQANPTAKLLDIKAYHIARWNNELEEHIEYSEEQLNTLVLYNKKKIEFIDSLSNTRKTYKFPTDRVTIRQLVDAIVDFEKISRPKYKWSGGIDCHHIFYEGIHLTEDGAYSIYWGS